MRMNFKIKPEAPAGSAAAWGCTPRPLGVTCSPSSALRGASGKGGRAVFSRKVLSLSQKHWQGPRCLAHLLTCSQTSRAPALASLSLVPPRTASVAGQPGFVS